MLSMKYKLVLEETVLTVCAVFHAVRVLVVCFHTLSRSICIDILPVQWIDFKNVLKNELKYILFGIMLLLC